MNDTEKLIAYVCGVPHEDSYLLEDDLEKCGYNPSEIYNWTCRLLELIAKYKEAVPHIKFEVSEELRCHTNHFKIIHKFIHEDKNV